MDPKTPLIHPHSLPGRPSAIEYFLPHPAIPLETLNAFSAWMHEIATSDEVRIRQVLVKRWKTINAPELAALREQLLSYKPVSIVARRSGFGSASLPTLMRTWLGPPRSSRRHRMP